MYLSVERTSGIKELVYEGYAYLATQQLLSFFTVYAAEISNLTYVRRIGSEHCL